MTLVELLDLVRDNYPTPDTISEMYDRDGRETPCAAHLGDTLALFITREVRDTFDENESSPHQVEAATQCLESAVRDLQAVIHSFDQLAVPRGGSVDEGTPNAEGIGPA